MTIYSLEVLLFLFGSSLLFHVQFKLLLPDLHTDFSRGRSGGLVFPSLHFKIIIISIFRKSLGPHEQAKKLTREAEEGSHLYRKYKIRQFCVRDENICRPPFTF